MVPKFLSGLRFLEGLAKPARASRTCAPQRGRRKRAGSRVGDEGRERQQMPADMSDQGRTRPRLAGAKARRRGSSEG